MSLNLNTVTLAGNLTRNPEMRPVGEKFVANFAVAINRRWKSAEGEAKEEVTFVECEAWGRTGELIGQYLIKGSPCYLEGRLKLDSWQDKDGQKRSRLKVVADNVQFLGRPKGSGEGAEATETAPAAAPMPSRPAPMPRRGAPQPVGALDDEQPPF